MSKKLIALAVGTALCFSFALPAMADDDDEDDAEVIYETITADDLLAVDDSNTIGDVAGLGQADLTEVIAKIIRAILGFLGVVAVIIILWGGFMWMTSGGAEEKIKNARKLIIMGIIGLAIVLASYAIAAFVITSLVGAVTE